MFDDWDTNTWAGFSIIYGFILFLTWGLSTLGGWFNPPMYYKLIFTFLSPALVYFFINNYKGNN